MHAPPFSIGIFLAVALFEACVNVMYMANRSAQAASGGASFPPLMKVGFALHGLPRVTVFGRVAGREASKV